MNHKHSIHKTLTHLSFMTDTETKRDHQIHKQITFQMHSSFHSSRFQIEPNNLFCTTTMLNTKNWSRRPTELYQTADDSPTDYFYIHHHDWIICCLKIRLDKRKHCCVNFSFQLNILMQNTETAWWVRENRTKRVVVVLLCLNSPSLAIWFI